MTQLHKFKRNDIVRGKPLLEDSRHISDIYHSISLENLHSMYRLKNIQWFYFFRLDCTNRRKS